MILFPQPPQRSHCCYELSHFYCKEGLRCSQIWPQGQGFLWAKVTSGKRVLFPAPLVEFENSEIKNIITVSKAFMSKCQLNKGFTLYNFTQWCSTQGMHVPWIHREDGFREEGDKHGHLEDVELELWRRYREAVAGGQRKGVPEETSWRSRGVRLEATEERWGYGWEIEIISEVPSYMVTLN